MNTQNNTDIVYDNEVVIHLNKVTVLKPTEKSKYKVCKKVMDYNNK